MQTFAAHYGGKANDPFSALTEEIGDQGDARVRNTQAAVRWIGA